MSGLETRAKDILSKIILTRNEASLDKNSQSLLSLWMQKTILVANKATPGGYDVPSSFHRELYKTQNALPNMMVSIGWRVNANGSKEHPLASFEIKQISKVEVEKSSVERLQSEAEVGRSIWTASIDLGYALFTVVGTDIDGQLEVGSSDPIILTVINPSDKQFEWSTEWPIETVGGLSIIRKAMYGEN